MQLEDKNTFTCSFAVKDFDMPRTFFYESFIKEIKSTANYVETGGDLIFPQEDVAVETNWPQYGDKKAAHTRNIDYNFEETGNYIKYLKNFLCFPNENKNNFLVLINMHPYLRLPLVLRAVDNLICCDGNLSWAERSLNPWAISFPALPLTKGIPNRMVEPRKVLASFQGSLTHRVRKDLASIAEKNRIIVNLVDQTSYFGKINAIKNINDSSYNNLLEDSTFAFVPRGHALFSYRLLEVMSYGCIPVILSDGWVLPFDRVINWPSISLRFGQGEISAIPAFLDSLSPDDIYRMQANVIEVYKNNFSNFQAIIDTMFSEIDVVIKANLINQNYSPKKNLLKILDNLNPNKLIDLYSLTSGAEPPSLKQRLKSKIFK